jgi:hypothetical protein
MFGLFKRDPAKALKKAYAQKLEEARDAQRRGDIAGYGALIAESEALAAELDRLDPPSGA